MSDDSECYFPSGALNMWKDSNDPVLEAFYEAHMESKEPPSEEEAVTNLTFFIIASIGCRELGLDKLADIFSKRADKYVAGLSQLGFSRECVRSHAGFRIQLGMLERIIRHSCGMVDHLSKESSRVDSDRRRNVKLVMPEVYSGSECRVDAQKTKIETDSKMVFGDSGTV